MRTLMAMLEPTESEIEALQRRHKDIWKDGAKALEREAKKRERQLRMGAFCDKHGVKCFKCGTGLNDWAKTGIGGRGPWAVCVQCVRRKKGE